jgi:hypothetical protein
MQLETRRGRYERSPQRREGLLLLSPDVMKFTGEGPPCFAGVLKNIQSKEVNDVSAQVA